MKEVETVVIIRNCKKEIQVMKYTCAKECNLHVFGGLVCCV